VTRLAQTRPLRAVDLPAGCWWQVVDTPQDVRAARVALRRSLGKDADGPVSRLLNRPLSTRLSMLLAPLRPAPIWCRWSRSRWVWLGGAAGPRPGPGRGAPGPGKLGRRRGGWGGGPAAAPGRPRGALLDGVLDRVATRPSSPGLGCGHCTVAPPGGVLVLTVAATTGALLSMASKDRAAALGLPPAPERALGWLLGGRDGRLLLVAVGAVLGAPVAALAATTATSALSPGLRVGFLRRPPARDVGQWG
jgi:hypothetical protein